MKDYFNFSRAERIGIFVLCTSTVLILCINSLKSNQVKLKAHELTAFVHEIAVFRQQMAALSEHVETITTEEIADQLFHFDPNTAKDEDWVKLGLNSRQIQNIRNYQAAGGRFRRKEDFQRLYTISATQYSRLEPYIRIVENVSTSSETKTTVTQTLNNPMEMEQAAEAQPALLIVELNLADSSLLTQLPGIGPVLANRTLRYRDLIGGFIDVAQLSEVYGINIELTERLSTQLSADSLLIRKIPINTASFRDIVRHPYISEQQARGILNYRRLQNRINNINELVRNNILEPEDAEKIRPYLSFE